MTSTAEALSGPWAANLPGWALTTALASVVVVLQELTTPFPHVGWIVLSAVLQMAVSTLWGAAVATISRRRYGRVVGVAAVLLWTGIGVSRGLIGGFVADAAGVDPEWFYRVAFWTLVSLCWIPLLTYALVQWDLHRRLLAVRAGLTEAFDDATARAAESAGDRTRRIARALDDALRPALDEIRAGLRQNTSLEATEVGAIASRLDELATRTSVFSAPVSVPAMPRPAGRVSVSEASRDFELGRPVLAALLAAATTAPLVLPEAYRDDGWISVAEIALALTVSTALLMAVFAALRPMRVSAARRSLLNRIGVLAAGLAGTVLIALLPWEPFQARDLAMLVAFPLIFVTAASTTVTAVALRATNVQLASHVEIDTAALDSLAARVRAADAAAAARLETLVRGDVNGRVASCALALGLLADGSMPPASRERVISGVLEQLDAAAAELRIS